MPCFKIRYFVLGILNLEKRNTGWWKFPLMYILIFDVHSVQDALAKNYIFWTEGLTSTLMFIIRKLSSPKAQNMLFIFYSPCKQYRGDIELQSLPKIVRPNRTRVKMIRDRRIIKPLSDWKRVLCAVRQLFITQIPATNGKFGRTQHNSFANKCLSRLKTTELINATTRILILSFNRTSSKFRFSVAILMLSGLYYSNTNKLSFRLFRLWKRVYQLIYWQFLNFKPDTILFILVDILI